MKFKNIFIILLVVFVLSLSAVSASELNDTSTYTSSNDDSQNLNTIDDYKLSDEGKSDFQQLEEQIKASSGSTLNLEKDYTGDGNETVHINDSVIIDGKGHAITKSNKEGLSAFEIVSGNVTLKNLKICDTYNEDSGGAIYVRNADSLTLENCIFTNNKADDHGGAIYIRTNTPIIIQNCIFESNTADDGGGAIYSNGALKLINSTFKYNKAIDNGGAIYYNNDKVLEIKNCTFESNEANDATTVSCKGGAIYNPKNSIMIVENSIFKSNLAQDSGGAIYSQGDVNLYNTTFESNNAKEDMTGDNNGGAVFGVNSVSADGCTFKSNEAIKKGGAIYAAVGKVVLKNSLFQSNTATGSLARPARGGAVFSEKNHVLVDSCIFENNHAKFGGAIYSEVSIKASNTSFSKNTANSKGGAIHSQTSVELKSCLFESNEVKGALIDPCHGGAVYAYETVTVNNCTFNGNFAEEHGGAIYAKNGLKLVGKESFFSNNTANKHGGAIYTSIFYENPVSATFINNYAKKNGGAIYINNKNGVKITKMAFIKNHCGGEGGAIYLDSSKSKLALEKNIFLSNSAKEGQSVYNCGKYTSIKNNWWGYTNPSSDNDQLIEWRPIPLSNVHHSDSSPLKLTLKLISDATKDEHAVENETVCALLSFKTSSEDIVNMDPIFKSSMVHFTSDKNIKFQDKGNNNDGVYSIFISKSEGEHEILADFYGYPVSATAITDEDSPGNDEGMDDDYNTIHYNTLPNYSPSFTQTLTKTLDNISNSTTNVTKNMTNGSAVKSIANPQSENGSFNYYIIALIALIVIAAIGIYKYKK